MLLTHKITGEGEPIILLHGLFGAKENLGMLARALQDQFQVVSVDLRNHGRSFHDKQASYPLMAEDVFRLMDHLDIASADIIGHSMGGKVAMQMALSDSNRVKQLIPIDIAPHAYPPHHTGIIEGLQQLNNTVLASRQQADQILSEYEPEPGTRQFLLTNLIRKEDKLLGLRLNVDGITANQQALCASLSGTPFSSPLKAAVLFIRGGDSDYIKSASLPVMEELFPNHQLVTIAGAGHMVHAEKPAEVIGEIEYFLKS